MRKRNRKMAQKAIRANPHALENTVANTSPTTPAEVTRIMAGVRLSFEKLRLGAGSEQDFRNCASVVNIGIVRAEAVDQQIVDAFLRAGEAVIACERIRRTHGSYGFTGPHMGAMIEALDLYQQLLELSTPVQMHAAATEADRRILAGHVEKA